MLLVAGDLVQDVVVWAHEPTRHGTDTEADVFVMRGGSAANVAAFAGPRCPTRFVGCVGEDVAGAGLVAELAGHGVDVRVQRREATGAVVVFVDETGERQMYPSRGSSRLLEPVDPAWLDGVQLVHLPCYGFADGSTPGALLDLAARVRAGGGQVSVDASSVGLIQAKGVGWFRGILAELAPDYLSANVDESPLVDLDALPATTLLARAGAEPTVIRRAGCEPVVVPVPPVAEIKDLTGAGDAFNAGFLSHLVTAGAPPSSEGPQALVPAVQAGHALSARVLASPGATEPSTP